MDYVVKFGVPGKVMGVVMMRPMMKKMFELVHIEHMDNP